MEHRFKLGNHPAYSSVIGCAIDFDTDVWRNTDALPRLYRAGCHTVDDLGALIIGAGDYDEAVNIRNKLATIMISSKAPENRARLKSLNAYYCRHIWLDSLNFDGTDLGADSACISAMCVGNMQMHDCEIAGSAAAFGVSSNGSSVFVMDTSISNCGVAILTTYNSLLTARVISGDNNKIGCSVHSSILNISNSTLQAATLTEKRGGGIIYKEGVQV